MPRSPLPQPDFLSQCKQLHQRVQGQVLGFAKAHRSTLMAAAIATLAGFGITAVAVAPLAARNEAPPPVQLISQEVQAPGLAEQAQALAVQGLRLSRSELTRSSDTADSLLTRLGVADAQASALLRQHPMARKLFAGRAGKMVQAQADANGNLLELVARFATDDAAQAKTHFVRLTLDRAANSSGTLQVRWEVVPMAMVPRMVAGTVRSTLFSATDEAGVPDSVATQLIELFSSEVDFHRSLRKGDSFRVVFETLQADGQPVAWSDGAGRLLAAEFVNDGQAHHALWFSQGPGKGGDYFGLDGRSRKLAFLASPLEFSRVTSGFAMRFHPLQKHWRAHLGVDYAAPHGTDVRTVGDGVVEFAGVRGGYGQVLEIRHDKNQSTVYAHLSRMEVREGQKVQQGQRIGLVGATGWATGPHLHFEFRVNGEHQDPLLLAKATQAKTLDAAAKQEFEERARAMHAQLDLAKTTLGPRRRSE